MKICVCQLVFVLLLANLPMPVNAQDHSGAAVTILMQNREVVNTENTLRFSEGDQIVLHWSTDESVEVHLHGYDISLEIAPGTPAEMRFEASVPGRFPITAHGFGDEHEHHTLLYLEIYPK